MRLTRKASFSSGHRYWREDLSDAENRALFGKWASRFSHGHNYTIEATIEGAINPDSGMVINIKLLKDMLFDRILSRFDQKSINDEVEEFRYAPPTTENLISFFAEQLQQFPPGVTLQAIRLVETPRLWCEWHYNQGDAMITLTRTYEFCASHRLHNPYLTHEQNVDLYGKCNNLYGHGHNYNLEVTVSGEIDPQSGMMVDISILDETINRHVVDYLDHRNLNEDIEELGDKIPTSEVVTELIWNLLAGRLPAKLVKVVLRETDRNSFEYSGPEA